MGSIVEDEKSADVLGQWPELKSYNHAIVIFRDPGYPRDMVKMVVEFGAEAIVEQIPWIADQVIHTGVSKTSSGRYETAPWPEDQPPNEMVRFKDCDDLMPSFQELEEAGFPIRMLPAHILCPVPGYPETVGRSCLLLSLLKLTKYCSTTTQRFIQHRLSSCRSTSFVMVC